jgi:hypothetical protein
VAIVVEVADTVELVLVAVVLVAVVLVEVVVVRRVVDVATLVDVLEADDTVVGADESPELLQPTSAAIIVAAEAAALHALLMATPPFGGC